MEWTEGLGMCGGGERVCEEAAGGAGQARDFPIDHELHRVEGNGRSHRRHLPLNHQPHRAKANGRGEAVSIATMRS